MNRIAAGVQEGEHGHRDGDNEERLDIQEDQTIDQIVAGVFQEDRRVGLSVEANRGPVNALVQAQGTGQTADHHNFRVAIVGIPEKKKREQDMDKHMKTKRAVVSFAEVQS